MRRAARKSILIASSERDKLTWRPVARLLKAAGCNIIIYKADKVANGSVPFEVQVGSEGLQVRYDGHLFDLASIDAAWLRRPNTFSDSPQYTARELILDKERSAMQSWIWDMIHQSKWLVAPSSMNYADRKVVQLELAHSIGFTIPKTIITNQWSSIIQNLPDDIAFKAMTGGIVIQEDLRKELYTTKLRNILAKLPTHTTPFPGIWQEYIPKIKEWRITVVGDKVFDAAIYTEDDAKDDWRKHQFGPNVQFRRETFPEDQKKLCLKYLRALGLRFGAFDFVENSKGIIFLECNSNGQYGWLEDQLGLPISQAIADELLEIAQRNRR